MRAIATLVQRVRAGLPISEEETDALESHMAACRASQLRGLAVLAAMMFAVLVAVALLPA